MITGINRTMDRRDIADVKLNVNNVIITPQFIQIDEVYSTIISCKLNPVALEVANQKYQSIPFVQFAQNISFKPFSQSPNNNGIDIVQEIYLKNATDFVISFLREIMK